MRVAGLVLSLVLLGIGLILLATDFVDLDFRSQHWLLLAVIAAVVYRVVWILGGSLGGELDAMVSRFTSGQDQELRFSARYTRVQTLLLFVLLPFFVYLLLFALHSAMALTQLVALPLVLRSRPRTLGPVIVVLIVVVVGTLVAAALGLYSLLFTRRGKPFGIRLRDAEHPGLWRLARDTASAVGARTVDDVVLCPYTGIGVHLAGSLLSAVLGKGRQVLTIGVPSVYQMSVGEFQAILAHEYAHFSHRDTQWGQLRAAIAGAITSAVEAAPGPRGTASGILTKLRRAGGNAVRLVMCLNPAYPILLVYVELFTRLFYRTTGGYLRVRELMADVLSARLYGGSTFRDALLRTSLDDSFFSNVVHPRLVRAMHQEGKAAVRLTEAIDACYRQYDDAEHGRVRESMASSAGEPSPFDSHPAVAVRVAYLGRFPDKPDPDPRPFEELLSDWAALDAQVTWIYNERLHAYVQSLPAPKKAGSAEGA